eukprot:scaffold184141_cov35-Tisochrysis_lutea.AAC.2
MKASSTLAAVFALVSRKMRPCSCAKAAPSSCDTARRCSKSDLLPISMMVMLELECVRASSSQEVRWLYVSRRVISYTSRAPAAPR